MKCSVDGCPGEYEQREIVHVEHHGNEIMVIEHVPAEVCTICGDVLFTPDTVRQLERLQHNSVRQLERLQHNSVRPTRTIPLYDFTQAKSA